MMRLKQWFAREPQKKNLNRSQIGLEFALEQLYMVQLGRTTEGYEVAAKGNANYPGTREELLSNPKNLKRLLKPLFSQKGFSSKNIVTALPISMVTIMPVTYTFASPEEEESALIQVLSERVEGDLSDYVVDYTQVRTQGNSQERLVLVALCRKDVIINFLESLRKAGLKVKELEIGPTAIHRLVSSQFDPDNIQNTMVINFGRDKSFFTVMSGRRLMLDKQMDFSENEIFNEIAGSLDLEFKEARALVMDYGITGEKRNEDDLDKDNASEISMTLGEITKPHFLKLRDSIHQTLLYVSSLLQGEQIHQVYITGGLSRWQGAAELLNELVEVPVEHFPEPHSLMNHSYKNSQVESSGSSSEWAVAMGLALREF